MLRSRISEGMAMLASVLGFPPSAVSVKPGDPEPFLDAGGHPLAGSISEKISVPINGVDQGMVIRGEDASNPVLLSVHGGPGMPFYCLSQDYPLGLEDLFTVVWWDQRGACLSYHSDIPRESMTIEQHVEDILAVSDYLRDRFGQEKIYLLGHSWGSFIAIQAAARAPEKYAAYFGMAQLVHQLESEKIAYDYMLATYRERGDRAMVRKLEAAPVTMSGGTPRAYLKVRDAAMHKLGVGTTHDMRSVFTGIFLRSLRFRGYTLREKVDLWRARAFCRSFGLWEQLIRIDLRRTVPELQLPVYFFEGKHDYTAVTSLAGDYIRQLRAPVKKFYVFDASAHSPLLEEPERAHHLLEHDVLGRNNSASSPMWPE
jgi:pimeloyl-ACP methyl ester carboxylesterase